MYFDQVFRENHGKLYNERLADTWDTQPRIVVKPRTSYNGVLIGLAIEVFAGLLAYVVVFLR